MKTIETILNHRSIRKYKTTPIEDSILNKVFECAFRASTTGNMQVYSIVVTKDIEKKKQLAPLHFNQPMVTQAPVMLTFCADFNRFNKWCEQNNATPGYDNFLSFMTGAIDALLAAQNACIGAESLGLGICYLGTTLYNAEKIMEVLKLPKGVIPITAITLGYPEEIPELVDRLPANGIIHYEEYNDFSSEEIKNIYADKEKMDLYKNLVNENNVENLAQVFTQKRYTKENNIHFSKTLLDLLNKQGFMNH
jgi:nitroreductase